MRRPELADVMLLATVTLWALNFTVTKYVISHGFQPIAYGVLRFGSAALVFGGVHLVARALVRARAPRPRHAGRRRADRDLPQPALVRLRDQADDRDDGRAPVRDAARDDRASSPALLGIERLNSRFWMAAVLAFGGAALVALGSGTGVSGQLWGDLLGFAASATWAWYTVAVSPLLQRYSTLRVSAVAFTIGTIPLLARRPAAARAGRTTTCRATIWLLLAFAIVGPLVVANLLWFGGISRVGPSRASVFANAQPFLAAVFSLLILSEPLGAPPGRRRLPDRLRDPDLAHPDARPRGGGGDVTPPRAPRPHAARLPLLDRPDPRDLLRPDGRAAARGARPDDRRDRPAHGGLRARRGQPVLVGLHRLRARLDGDGAAVREARRRARAQAAVHDRDLDLPRRLGALRRWRRTWCSSSSSAPSRASAPAASSR